jgi:F0F1-type ATP synthase assembly protein I
VHPLCYGARGLSGPGDQASAVAKAYRAAAPWLAATWQFVGAALVGVAVGWGVDQWLSSMAGYGVVVGGLLGSVLGCVAFIRTAVKLLEPKGKS